MVNAGTRPAAATNTVDRQYPMAVSRSHRDRPVDIVIILAPGPVLASLFHAGMPRS
jgi:hypothetical protein